MNLKNLSFSRRDLGLVALVLIATAASAATLKQFTPNSPALAADVNANFAVVNPPSGTIVAYAGQGGAPAGWLFCDGTTFSGTTYPDLQAALGSTTLPDLRGRVIVGVDPGWVRVTNGAAQNVGSAGGSDLAVLPAHTHGIDPDGAHAHNMRAACGGSCANASDGFARGNGGIDATTFYTQGVGNHSHGGATQSAGTAGATNMQPFLTLRYLIKT